MSVTRAVSLLGDCPPTCGSSTYLTFVFADCLLAARRLPAILWQQHVSNLSYSQTVFSLLGDCPNLSDLDSCKCSAQARPKMLTATVNVRRENSLRPGASKDINQAET